ncbi:Uncharacterized protein APZ42_031822, partial [Daphnia magna]
QSQYTELQVGTEQSLVLDHHTEHQKMTAKESLLHQHVPRHEDLLQTSSPNLLQSKSGYVLHHYAFAGSAFTTTLRCQSDITTSTEHDAADHNSKGDGERLDNPSPPLTIPSNGPLPWHFNDILVQAIEINTLAHHESRFTRAC